MVRKTTFLLNCKVDDGLRKYTGHKGDLSKVLNEAAQLWLDVKEGRIIVSSVQLVDGEKKQ